jgi:hypothetical protein
MCTLEYQLDLVPIPMTCTSILKYSSVHTMVPMAMPVPSTVPVPGTWTWKIVLNLVLYSWLQRKKVFIKITYMYVLTGQLAPKFYADSKTGLKKFHKI